jgi:poly [ADP-ribose] polymerase
MKILTLGKLSRSKEEVKATIESLGGKVTGTARKASLCVSTKSEYGASVRDCVLILPLH